jgi:hypothetical protein
MELLLRYHLYLHRHNYTFRPISRPSAMVQRTQQQCKTVTRLYIYICIYIHSYIFMYVCVCIYITARHEKIYFNVYIKNNIEHLKLHCEPYILCYNIRIYNTTKSNQHTHTHKYTPKEQQQ